MNKRERTIKANCSLRVYRASIKEGASISRSSARSLDARCSMQCPPLCCRFWSKTTTTFLMKENLFLSFIFFSFFCTEPHTPIEWWMWRKGKEQQDLWKKRNTNEESVCTSAFLLHSSYLSLKSGAVDNIPALFLFLLKLFNDLISFCIMRAATWKANRWPDGR